MRACETPCGDGPAGTLWTPSSPPPVASLLSPRSHYYFSPFFRPFAPAITALSGGQYFFSSLLSSLSFFFLHFYFVVSRRRFSLFLPLYPDTSRHFPYSISSRISQGPSARNVTGSRRGEEGDECEYMEAHRWESRGYTSVTQMKRSRNFLVAIYLKTRMRAKSENKNEIYILILVHSLTFSLSRARVCEFTRGYLTCVRANLPERVSFADQNLARRRVLPRTR